MDLTRMAVWLVSDSDSIGYHFSFLSISRICLAGTPPTTVLAATSFVTTDPAAIMALSPTVTPRRMVELEPTHTFLPNRIGAGAVTQRHTAMILEVATGIDKDTTPDGNILAEVCVERRKHLECFVHRFTGQARHERTQFFL